MILMTAEEKRATDMAIQAGAVYTAAADGRPTVFMLSAFELAKLVGLAHELCALHCESAAMNWKDADHRRAATVLAHGIRAMGKA